MSPIYGNNNENKKYYFLRKKILLFPLPMTLNEPCVRRKGFGKTPTTQIAYSKIRIFGTAAPAASYYHFGTSDRGGAVNLQRS